MLEGVIWPNSLEKFNVESARNCSIQEDNLIPVVDSTVTASCAWRKLRKNFYFSESTAKKWQILTLNIK